MADPCDGCGVAEGRPSLCCQEFVIETPCEPSDASRVNLGMLHWYLVRGFRLGWRVEARFDDEVPSVNVSCWEVLIPQPCPMLDGNRCSIYDRRPSICREYPPFPAVRADNRYMAVSGCERYQPRPPVSASFSEPDALAAALTDWFGYSPERHVRYVPDMRRVRVVGD